MDRITKALLIAITLASTSISLTAQTPYRQYANDGILLNFHEIDDVYFRTFLLYNLSQENRFILIADEEPGLFSISSGDVNSIGNFYEEYESFYHHTLSDFSLLSKAEISNKLPEWKNCIQPSHFVSMMLDISLRNSRTGNDNCAESDPFCTSDVITFAAAATSQTADQLEGTIAKKVIIQR